MDTGGGGVTRRRRPQRTETVGTRTVWVRVLLSASPRGPRGVRGKSPLARCLGRGASSEEAGGGGPCARGTPRSVVFQAPEVWGKRPVTHRGRARWEGPEASTGLTKVLARATLPMCAGRKQTKRNGGTGGVAERGEERGEAGLERPGTRQPQGERPASPVVIVHFTCRPD